MAKPSNNNTNKPTPPAKQPQEGVENANLQQGADNNVAGDANLGDQDRVADLAFVFPVDANEGIDAVLGLLKGQYPDADFDALLADRFATELEPVDTHTPRDLLPVTGFELAFPLDHLADNITEGLLAIQTALDEHRAPEGVVFPEPLVGFQFPLTVLERYIQATLLQERRLEEVELVFADPAIDSHLKTLNFSRYLQGLDPTHFYLRFV